eukprot:2696466-Prymnesium_polylepis.1
MSGVAACRTDVRLVERTMHAPTICARVTHTMPWGMFASAAVSARFRSSRPMLATSRQRSERHCCAATESPTK